MRPISESKVRRVRSGNVLPDQKISHLRSADRELSIKCRGNIGSRVLEDGFAYSGEIVRVDGREQYGNNLGRKPSQMIPNNPKSVAALTSFVSIVSADSKPLRSIGRGP